MSLWPFGKERPKLLISDNCGDAYCPRCGKWLSEHHPKDKNPLSEKPKRYCHHCGQRLLWEVKIVPNVRNG